jgi:DNA ligase-1
VPDREAAIAHYTWCRDKGFEGTVLKPFNYPYVQKRSPYWMKLKSIDSLDLKVVDYFEGTGKYRGMLGGIIVDFRGKEVRVGTGISDDQRESWWENRHKLIGHTAEVLYQEITPTDSLRHPRFLRWRHDK